MSQKNQTQVKLASGEAEQSVLGGLLIDQSKFDEIDLVEDEFYFPKHKELYSVLRSMHDRGMVLDTVVLCDELKRKNKMDSIGGVAFLAQLMDYVPTAANIGYHAKIVREKATRRKLVAEAESIVKDAYGEKTTEELVEEAERKVFAISESGLALSETRFQPFAGILHRAVTGIKKREIGIKTGFRDIDGILGGLRPGALYIIAARPAMGKSALAANIATNVAKRGTPVGIVTLEMADTQFASRMIAAEACVDVTALEMGNGEVHEADPAWQRIEEAVSRMETWPIFMDESMSVSIQHLKKAARRFVAERGQGLLIVDYLQLMQSDDSNENRTQEISKISRGLVVLAKELNIPIIALSQLSRAVEQTADKRPMLSHLRESGSIEQDAFAVAFVYRPEVYFGPVDADGRNLVGRTEVIVAKHRSGSVGTAYLRYQPELTKFYTTDYQPE